MNDGRVVGYTRSRVAQQSMNEEEQEVPVISKAPPTKYASASTRRSEAGSFRRRGSRLVKGVQNRHPLSASGISSRYDLGPLPFFTLSQVAEMAAKWNVSHSDRALACHGKRERERERENTKCTRTGRVWLVECCFTSTETVGLLGTGAQDGRHDFHTAPELSDEFLELLT